MALFTAKENYENASVLIRHTAENARARVIALTKPLNQSIGAAIHIADIETYSNNNPSG